MQGWEIEAREELRELLASYYKLGDSGRIEEQAGLFEPDGVVAMITDYGIVWGFRKPIP